MRTIGMIGGMSWESSLAYYRIVNETVKARLGGLHSAKVLLHSVDFAEIEACQQQGRWQDAGQILANAAAGLERAGANFVLLCCNTMYIVTDQIEAAVSIPLLHIADATALPIVAQGLKRIGLLGTRFTMTEGFIRDRLTERFGLEVLIPDADDRIGIDRVIYEELSLGIFSPDSRTFYRNVMARLVQEGAEGIILGCTEIGLLVNSEDSPVPLFDTARLHAVAAIEMALSAD